MIELARPWLLLLLVPVLALLWRRRRRARESAAVRYPFLALLPLRAGVRVRAHRLAAWLPTVALMLLVLALSGPRVAHLTQEVEGEGIDIVVSLDISSSMRALDFQPRDRLAVAKQVIRDFIAERHHDHIGLVLFAAKAFTQCPLTLDRAVLTRFLDEVEVGLIDDGTAIGLGLATAVNRLKHSAAKSKTVILLTDGQNNVSTLEPETAAELAAALGVRVYTIGVGREGTVPYPVDDPLFGRRTRQIETRIDEDLLERVAAATGGSYFRATDPETLAEIFRIIDRLERTRYETRVSTMYRELFPWLAAPALLAIVLQAWLGATWLRRLP